MFDQPMTGAMEHQWPSSLAVSAKKGMAGAMIACVRVDDTYCRVDLHASMLPADRGESRMPPQTTGEPRQLP